MDSRIEIFPRENGQQQRVLIAQWDSWEDLDFLSPAPAPGALDSFYDIYRQYLIPACPWIFKNIVMFRLPEDLEVPYSMEGLADPLTAATLGLNRGMKLQKGKPVFRDAVTRDFFRELKERDCVRLLSGKCPGTQVIPVANTAGYLEESASLAMNASFFIMDPFDCATAHDHIGIPIGLMVKDGVVKNPPLYHREALVVKKDGSVAVTLPRLEDMTLSVGGRKIENPVFFTRPKYARTPRQKGQKVTVVGERVVAVSHNPSVEIPAAGFVMLTDTPVCPGEAVCYGGMEDVVFAIQVGNSLVQEGKAVDGFISHFYNIYRLQPVPYPPCLYPLDYQKARAARIVLGADKDGKPIALWAEGKGKLGHDPQTGSTGASLWELAQICQVLGIENAVNLDGGGSAQILQKGNRLLRVSDRNPQDFSDAPRPIPLGLVVK